MNDYIRRRMGRVPGIDMLFGLPSGVPSPPNPIPGNQNILNALNDAIDWLNGKVRCGPVVWTASVAVSAAGAAVVGAYPVDVSSDDSNTLLLREVTDVVLGYPLSVGGTSQTGYTRLRQINYSAMLAGDAAYQQEAPVNVPDRYFVTGTTLCLVPPPNQALTMYLFQTEAIPQLAALTDTIVGPPVGLHSVIYQFALSILCATDYDTSQAMANKAQAYEQLAISRLPDVIAWKQGYDPTNADVLRDISRMVSSGEQQRRASKGQMGVGA
jgi:hypothetical protein